MADLWEKDSSDVARNRSVDHFDASARPIVRVDVAKYQSYLDNSGLSDLEKEEVLRALWSIIVAFIDLGFGVHPQQEVCGQNCEIGIQGPMEIFKSATSEAAIDSQIPGAREVE